MSYTVDFSQRMLTARAQAYGRGPARNGVATGPAASSRDSRGAAAHIWVVAPLGRPDREGVAGMEGTTGIDGGGVEPTEQEIEAMYAMDVYNNPGYGAGFPPDERSVSGAQRREREPPGTDCADEGRDPVTAKHPTPTPERHRRCPPRRSPARLLLQRSVPGCGVLWWCGGFTSACSAPVAPFTGTPPVPGYR